MGINYKGKYLGSFFSVETKCAFLLIILAKGSSSVWQNSVKYILSVCYVVIVYTNMKCYLPSRVLESRMAVTVRHRSLQCNLACMHLGAFRRHCGRGEERDLGQGWQWGPGWG